MKQTTYQATVIVDGDGIGLWPVDSPSPNVGDEITGNINGQYILGTVVKREWGIAVRDEPPVQSASLRIIVESQPQARPAQATVQPLKL